MKKTTLLFSSLLIGIFACKPKDKITITTKNITKNAVATSSKEKHFRGAFSNGMKGDSIFFTISADSKTLSNLTFKGYWRCSGSLERVLSGPKGTFNINDGKASGHLSEPPEGGSTAWRFDIDAELKDNSASGTFRMNINNLGCDTYKLKFTAVAE